MVENILEEYLVTLERVILSAGGDEKSINKARDGFTLQWRLQ